MNGLIEQWGKTSSEVGTNLVQNFIITFYSIPNVNFVTDYSSRNADYRYGVYSVDYSSFGMFANGGYAYWQAKGY